jgi:hypothetical protein
MKVTTACLTAFLSFTPLGAYAADMILHYCKDLTADQFRRAAKTAFGEKYYTIEQESSGSVVGTDGLRKVEIAMTAPGDITLRWAPGSEDKNEKHITKLGEQVLWALATSSKPGEVTINWCKDLTADRFHEVALAALDKRKYTIEKDTPSSIIGGQKKYKVEITMDAPGRITIRWVPGYGYKKNNWLDNLSRDVMSILAL